MVMMTLMHCERAIEAEGKSQGPSLSKPLVWDISFDPPIAESQNT